MEDFIEIEHKKPIYKIKAPLREHLKQFSRLADLPISYDDLLRFQDLIPLTDKNGDETLWFGALYNESENDFFHQELIKIYQLYFCLFQFQKEVVVILQILPNLNSLKQF